MTTVAVLGTGIMGAPMARNLASAGHDVRAWNRTPAKAEGLGATVAGSPAEAAADAGLDLPLPSLIGERMLRVVEAGHGAQDMSATFLASCPEP